MKYQPTERLLGIQFKFLLWGLGLIMNVKSRWKNKFKKHLDGIELVLQFQTEDKFVARYYVFKDQVVRSYKGNHEKPSTTLSFMSARYAIGMMMKRDPMEFMRGVQQHKISAVGNVDNLMWFMAATKHLP